MFGCGGVGRDPNVLNCVVVISNNLGKDMGKKYKYK